MADLRVIVEWSAPKWEGDDESARKSEPANDSAENDKAEIEP